MKVTYNMCLPENESGGGGNRYKISLKKGCHLVWVPNKWGLFWCGLFGDLKGSFSVQK